MTKRRHYLSVRPAQASAEMMTRLCHEGLPLRCVGFSWLGWCPGGKGKPPLASVTAVYADVPPGDLPRAEALYGREPFPPDAPLEDLP